MGAFRSTPIKDKDTKEGQSLQGQVPQFRYVSSGMQGWRINMEDASICHTDLPDNCALFGVFDGHGGLEVAKYCEDKFRDELIKNPNYKNKNYEKALEETFLHIDEMLQTPEGKKDISLIKQKFDKSGDDESFAGCTANVVLITSNKLYVANAGDSRCVVSIKGEAKAMSEDHKPDDEPEKNRILKAGGEVWQGRVNGNLNLSRAIGDLEYKANKDLKPEEQLIISKPDVKTLDITKDLEFIIIGCDGIWECQNNQLVISHFTKGKNEGKNLRETTESLLDMFLAKDTGGQSGLDNMSIIAIDLKP